MTAEVVTATRVELVRRIVSEARRVLDGTMADVTQAQAEYLPPGLANPLGATFAHVVCSEDMLVQGLFRQTALLAATTWAGRTGLSEPIPMVGQPEWSTYGAWTRRVTIDLAQLREYARAVGAETDAWLATLTESELDRSLDLSSIGLGQDTLANAIPLLVAHHMATETGEIAVLKGIQGARGYPF